MHTLPSTAGKPAEATKLYQQLPPGGAGEVGGPAVLAKLARAAAASGDTASIAALCKDVPGASGKGKGAGPAYDLEALEGFSKAVVKRREDRKRDAEEPAEQQPKVGGGVGGGGGGGGWVGGFCTGCSILGAQCGQCGK